MSDEMIEHSDLRTKALTEAREAATKRARAATAVFVLAGAIALFIYSPLISWEESWPLVVFYALLVLNTYFSVSTFSPITPKSLRSQMLSDIALAILIALLPFTFRDPLAFTFFATFMFAVATLKYILLSKVIGISRLLYRKMKIDALGTILCLVALFGILLGFGLLASVLLTTLFSLANLYVLWWRPLYREKGQKERP